MAKRPWWFGPAAMGGSLLLAGALLGVLELGLRVAGMPDPGLYAGDPAQLWTLRPGLDRQVPGPEGDFTVQTSVDALRDALPDGGDWTLALGCSTTFGWGVEAQQSWPAVLSGLTGDTVVNGGVPGWSTHQASRGAGRWLQAGPSTVVLAYGVRDAWPSRIEDHQVPATPWLSTLHLVRLMRGPGASTSDGSEAPTVRVPAERYRANLETLLEQAGSARVVLLDFPRQEPDPEHSQVLADLARERALTLVAPQLDGSLFFADDPVHLTAQGHQQLAEEVATALRPPGTSPPPG